MSFFPSTVPFFHLCFALAPHIFTSSSIAGESHPAIPRVGSRVIIPSPSKKRTIRATFLRSLGAMTRRVSRFQPWRLRLSKHVLAQKPHRRRAAHYATAALRQRKDRRQKRTEKTCLFFPANKDVLPGETWLNTYRILMSLIVSNSSKLRFGSSDQQTSDLIKSWLKPTFRGCPAGSASRVLLRPFASIASIVVGSYRCLERSIQ